MFNKFLFQSGGYFFYSTHGLLDIVVAGGVAHAEAVGISESITTNRRNVAFLKKIHRKIGGVVDNGLAIALANEAGALGEEVEGTLGDVDFQSGNLTSQTHDEITTFLKGLAHLLDTVLAALVSGECCHLADIARALVY